MLCAGVEDDLSDFGAFQRCLQIAEARVGLVVRAVLRPRQQARQLNIT